MLVAGVTYGAKKGVLILVVSSVLNDLKVLEMSIGTTRITHEECNHQLLDWWFVGMPCDVLV